MKQLVALVALFALFAFALTLSTSVQAQFCESSSILLPNLTPFPASELRVTNDRGKKKGIRRLRFSTLSWNKGSGALELIGCPPAPGLESPQPPELCFPGTPLKPGEQIVYQTIFCADLSVEPSSAGLFTYHETHAHTHVDNYAIYHLMRPSQPSQAIASGNKTTFCIIDTDEIDSAMVGNPGSATYTSCSADEQGMSVGWGDKYSYNLADQDIDITNLQPGQYQLIIDINPIVQGNRAILEESYDDNTSCVYIDYDDSGSGSVSLVGDGNCDAITETGIVLKKARPYKYRGNFRVDLQWTNYTGVFVDICRDDTKIVEGLSSDTSTYTDDPLVGKKEDGTLIYKVCDETVDCATQDHQCSNPIAVNY